MGDPVNGEGSEMEGSAEESLSQFPGSGESFPWPPRFKIKIINDNIKKEKVKVRKILSVATVYILDPLLSSFMFHLSK